MHSFFPSFRWRLKMDYDANCLCLYIKSPYFINDGA